VKRLINFFIAGALVIPLSLVGAIPADAAKWVKTASTSSKASYEFGTKDYVGPRGFSKPRGYVYYVPAFINIRKASSSTWIARGTTRAYVGPGRYVVQSVYKYRTKTPSTATIKYSESGYADSCLVLTKELSYGPPPLNDPIYTFTGRCSLNISSSTFLATWKEQDYPYGYGQSCPVGSYCVAFTTRPYGVVYYNKQVPTFTYGPIKKAYRWRYHTITKVYNAPTVTYAEYKSVRTNDTLATVRAKFGSRGKLTYASDFLGKRYTWKTNKGGTVTVWFGGYGYTGANNKSWSTF
jgi:hypothetical protein